jgi:hypothetical protein
LAATAVLFGLPFLLMYSGLYTPITSDLSLPHLDYPFLRSAPEAELVIYGDSTCAFGVDPNIVKNLTQLSSVNICESAPILTATGWLPLESYLRSHKRPKYLLLAVSPRNVPPNDGGEEFGATYLTFHYGAWPSIYHMTTRKPQAPLMFASEFANRSIFQPNLTAQNYQWALKRLQQDRGRIRMENPSPLQSCSGSAPAPDRARAVAYLNSFSEDYAHRGYTTAVFFTPLPNCDPQSKKYQEVLEGLGLNEPEFLSKENFVADKQASHPMPNIVPLVSSRLAEVLKTLAQERSQSQLAAKRLSPSAN